MPDVLNSLIKPKFFNPDYAIGFVMRAENARKSVPILQSGSNATDFKAVSGRNRFSIAYFRFNY